MAFQRTGDVRHDRRRGAAVRGPAVPDREERSEAAARHRHVTSRCPMIAVVTDLGGAVPGLHAAAGLYAPNAYPFRDMNTVNGKPYFANDARQLRRSRRLQRAAAAEPLRHRRSRTPRSSCRRSPSRTRINAETRRRRAVLGRLRARSSRPSRVWGLRQRRRVHQARTASFTLDAKRLRRPTGGSALTYRPDAEHRARRRTYTLPIAIHAQGDAHAVNGPAVDPRARTGPVVHADATTAALRGGRHGDEAEGLRRCRAADDRDARRPLQVPRRDGKLSGDVELDRRLGALGRDVRLHEGLDLPEPERLPRHRRRAGRHGRDAEPASPLKDSASRTASRTRTASASAAAGAFPVGDNTLIARGGVGYDTRGREAGLVARRHRRRGAHDDRGGRVVQDEQAAVRRRASA